MAGLPVTITSGGLPVTITGTGAQSIPISGIGVPPGATGDQVIVTNAAGTALVAAPGMFETVLFQSSIPFIFASSGSIGNNGALSGLTALPATYANAYILVPAGAIAAGIPAAAAWYYVQMSSGTAGTIFNNVYTSGQPTIPGSPTAFSTTGPGAFTGVSAATNAQAFSLAGLTMGIRDTVRVSYKASTTNTAANKVLAAMFGAGTADQSTVTTVASTNMIIDISNRDVTGAQIAVATGQAPAQSGNNFNFLTVDTTSAVVIALTGTNSTPATNNIVMESIVIELLKGS